MIFKCARLLLMHAAVGCLFSLPAYADIFEYAADCNPKLLEAEIAKGADPAQSDDFGNTVLHWAARNAGYECVKMLLTHPLEINAQNQDGETPFMKAAISSSSDGQSQIKTLELLHDAGADPFIPNRFDYSPLFALIVYGNNMSIVLDKSMLEPDPETGLTEFKDGEYDIAEQLLAWGADPNATDNQGQYLMQFAVEYRSPRLLDLLVKHGAKLDASLPPYGRSYLHHAVIHNPINIQYLLKQGLNIDTRDNDGGTPLMIGAAQNKTRAVRQLLALGADLDAKDKYGFTPALFASYMQSLEMLKLLIEFGADVNAQTRTGHNTPLHYAAKKGWKAGVELLLENGADPKIKSIQGQSAPDIARDHKHDDIARLMENHQ